MGFEEALEWYCKPVPNGVWTRQVDNAFGAYTPCATDSFVLVISHLVLLVLCLYRIWRTMKDHKVERLCLRSKLYSYLLALLAAYGTAEPLFRLIMGVSVLDLDGDGLPPYEAFGLGVEAFTWGSVVIMIFMETKIYIHELRWYVRFAVIYALVGDMVLLNLVLSVKEFYTSYVLYLYISEVAVQALFGTLLFVHLPNLDPYPGYMPMRSDTVDDHEYEELSEGHQICPERHANIFDRIFFSWINPLMTLGTKRPLTETDVWHLDTWDQTETLFTSFQQSWDKELQKPKPWLLRALNSSLGGRFWWGGFWKIGNDCSQFVGPLLLNQLLKSMQQDEPAYMGYIYAFSIFVGVVLGVLCEAQYFQNVMRVGYRLRSALIAAVFRKSLRLTNEGRRKFQTGKITNLMTTDAESLQQICQSLHTMWSAPFRIIVALILLYQQLGVASLIGALLLVLMFPLQTVIISKMQNLTKEGLQRTDKRIGLMNEVLAAMDTVKCYAWENSFQSKVQTVRDDELSWFRKSQLLGALNMFILNSIPVITFSEFALVLSDTRIETTLKASFLDAGGISNRRRRASLTLGCSTPCFFYVYSVFVVSLATAVTSVDVSSRKMVVVESHSVWLLIYGFGVTRSDRSWGVPLSSSSTASFIFRKRRVSTYPPTTNAELPTGDYQPHFGERIVRRYGSGFYRSDLPPNPPLTSHSLLLKLSCGESFNPRRPLPRLLTSYPPDRRTEPALLPTPDSARPSAHRYVHIAVRLFHRRVISIFYAEVGQQRLVIGFISPSVFNCNILSPVSQPTKKWGILVYLAIFLEIFGGFTKVFTETNLHLLDHFSCSKSIIHFHLPVGSPGPSLSSFASFLRSDLPPILWRCLSISITILLSCGAVRLGPEDTAGFVSTSFRGADWMLTSQFKVTISLLSDHAGKATLTHSNTVLSSLSSSSFEDLSLLSHVVVVDVFNQRGWTIPSIICNQAS